MIKNKLVKTNQLIINFGGIYAPKNCNNSNTKNAGQTNAFKIPRTPFQKPVAEEI